VYRLAVGLFVFTVLGWSQEPASPAKTSLPVPRLDRGSVEGKTYKNTSVGLNSPQIPALNSELPS
jgi:hypothetical protein